MAQVLKFLKISTKIFVTLMIIFTFSTFLNGNISRPKIQHFHIWKIQEDDLASSPKKPLDVRYILLWLEGDLEWDVLKEKQVAFEENKCAYTNCYITANKQLLEYDYRNFDAILINGKTIAAKNYTLPLFRLPHQKYIFGTKESADNYPICDIKFDNYFNLTWTYRLDSDAPWPYFSIFNNRDEEVGPKINVNWSTNYYPIDDKEFLDKKEHAAAWFSSNCYTNSKREVLVNNIKIYLRKYGLRLETVGSCGTRECPHVYDEFCMRILEHFYFFLAFENSIAEDYVSEKVLKALFHGNIPVVFGGADYSRFLPPHSYLDAGQLGDEATAATMAYLIENKTAYLEYLQWQNTYHYSTSTHSICDLCEVLNKDVGKVYQNFREWWNPDYKSACKGHHKESVKKANGLMLGIWDWIATSPSRPLWYKARIDGGLGSRLDNRTLDTDYMVIK